MWNFCASLEINRPGFRRPRELILSVLSIVCASSNPPQKQKKIQQDFLFGSVPESYQTAAGKQSATLMAADVTEGTAAAGVASSVQIVRPVIEIGSDLAFALDEITNLPHGSGEFRSREDEIHLFEDGSAFRGCKVDDTNVVCTWLQKLGDSALQLFSVRDVTRYSPRSCLGIVDLKQVDREESYNRNAFVDPACRDKLLAAL